MLKIKDLQCPNVLGMHPLLSVSQQHDPTKENQCVMSHDGIIATVTGHWIRSMHLLRILDECPLTLYNAYRVIFMSDEFSKMILFRCVIFLQSPIIYFKRTSSRWVIVCLQKIILNEILIEFFTESHQKLDKPFDKDWTIRVSARVLPLQRLIISCL